MTAPIEPSRVTAGDTLTWLKSLPDYPASAGWVLSYTFISPLESFSVTATAQGDDHRVSVAAGASAGWPPGDYTWSSAVKLGAQRYTLERGSLHVEVDLAGEDTFDNRSSARKALDAVNLALETYGHKAYLHSYEISGRKQQFHTPADFLAFRSRLKAEVAREDNMARMAAGLAPRNQVKVRFTTR